jgi:hypothetical protein
MIAGAGITQTARNFGASLGLAVLGTILVSQTHSGDPRLAFAHATQTVFHIMAGVLAFTFLVALRGLPRGRVERAAEEPVAVMASSSTG